MFTKLVLKILFKATLPLAAMVGIASYGLYAAGGDPLSILNQVTGGFSGQIANLTSSAGSSIDAARRKTSSSFSSGDGGESQTLYRWKDASGVTHFSSNPPESGAAVEQVKVNPNMNLMAAPKPYANTAKASKVNNTGGNGAGQLDVPEVIPGMGGILRRGVMQQNNAQQSNSQLNSTQTGNLPTESMQPGMQSSPNDLIKQFKKTQEYRESLIP